MYERRHQPLLPRPAFARRVLRSAGVASLVMVASLGMGMLGYHVLEGFSWLDAFLNASMILGGMGPVGELHTAAGKLFAGSYAIYCGLVIVTTTGLLLAPFLHRLMHHFHADAK